MLDMSESTLGMVLLGHKKALTLTAKPPVTGQDIP
jgi:hypothetical protein